MKSELSLTTQFQYGRTVISDMYFTSPYKIMSPFTDGRHIEIMQMSASAGMLSGDVFDLKLQFRENSDVTYVSQSYDKIFQSKGEQTRKNVTLHIGAGAKVKYMPYPMIPFSGCDFVADNQVYLNSTATFFYCDVFSCGRIGMGEAFKMKRYQSKTRIYLENELSDVSSELVFADHTLIDPQQFAYQTMGMWDNYTHNGICYLYIPDREQETKLLQQIRSLSEKTENLVGTTRGYKGIVIRVLSLRGEKIWNFMKEVAGFI